MTRILDVETGERRTLPHPIYTIAPNGETAFGVDFERIFRLHPGYGYPPAQVRKAGIGARRDLGIYAIGMRTGAASTLVSLRELRTLGDASATQPRSTSSRCSR